MDIPILAIKGLPGWTVRGRHLTGTYHVGPYDALPDNVPHAVDLTHIYENQDLGTSAHQIWNRPNLDLGLPDDNVRNLFEGCIGHGGSTEGHVWDGNLQSLESTDNVGLNVYLEILRAIGGRFVK